MTAEAVANDTVAWNPRAKAARRNGAYVLGADMVREMLFALLLAVSLFQVVKPKWPTSFGFGLFRLHFLSIFSSKFNIIIPGNPSFVIDSRIRPGVTPGSESPSRGLLALPCLSKAFRRTPPSCAKLFP